MPALWPNRLVDWFRANQRRLPWREAPTPYRVWVSEVMLQQTQVATVVPYFQRFVARFPDIASLAVADVDDVLHLWQGLGYYSRARNLHRAAAVIVAERGGNLPACAAQLQTIPGIGPYTAAAVASIAFGEPVPVVDGNVLRVAARLFGIAEDIRKQAVRRRVEDRLTRPVHTVPPAEFNQAIMELGATLCTPHSPACGRCPLRPDCVALAQGLTSRLPVRSPRPRRPHHNVAVALIRQGDSLLIAKRPVDRMLGGLWELPGGKQRPDEQIEEALYREIREELAVRVVVERQYPPVAHAYSHFEITLHPFECRIVDGTPQPCDADQLAWVTPGQLAGYAFPRGTLKVFAAAGLVD